MCASATDADMWDRRYSAPDLVWGAGPNRRLVTEVGGLPIGRALDLGAGEGRNALWLASLGWRVTAVDFSPVGISRLRAMAAERNLGVDAVVADLRRYEPPSDAFDLVILLYLQVPADLLELVLARASRALAPGGTLLLIGHDVENLERGYGGPPDPAVLQSPEQVKAALAGTLQIEAAERVERQVDTPEGPRTASDTLVRARCPGGPGTTSSPGRRGSAAPGRA